MKIFRVEFQVRGYELDGYGHVNNAVYLNYAEFARWRMIEDVSGGQDYFKRNGVSPVVVRVEIDYREPCLLADWIVVETTLAEYRKRVATFHHKIMKRESGKLAANLVVTLLVVGPTGKAVSLPIDFQPMFSGDPA